MKRRLNRETLVGAAIILFLMIFSAVRSAGEAGAGMGFPTAGIAALIVLAVRKNEKRKDDES